MSLDSPSHLEELLALPAVDTAILQAYKQLCNLKSQGDLPTRTASEWKEDKRRILECLVPIHRKAQPSREAVDAANTRRLAQQATNGSHEPLTLFQLSPGRPDIPQSYHTPVDTPASAPRASSPTRSLSAKSDRTATLDDPQPTPGKEQPAAPFSPADSVSRGSRRRRSSSTMQSDKPGKRARGPQEHICPVCHKKFPFLSKLNDHLKTHSADKNLRCHICKKSFKRTREVNAHLKTVHKIEPHSQPQTPPAPVPRSLPPPTPTTLPLPPTPAQFTPSASLALPPPRPSAGIGARFPGAYTPQPTPDQFNQPTPAETDYRGTPPAFTPASEDEHMRDREASYQGEGEQEDVKPKFVENKDKEGLDLASRFGGVDINRHHQNDPDYDNVTLPPLLNYPPKTQSLPPPPPPPPRPPTNSFPPINETTVTQPPQAPKDEKDVPDPPDEELRDAPRIPEQPASESPERKSPESIDTPSLDEQNVEDKKVLEYEAHALFGNFQGQ
jgi:hypothetical protein